MSINTSNKKQFQIDMKNLSIKHKLYLGEELELIKPLDPRRQISYNDKKILWNNSICPDNFDPEYFRKDILGNICIKGFTTYGGDSQKKCFAYNIEHILSYSNGGRSILENTCLLNAGINKSKGSNELWRFNYYWIVGLSKVFAVNCEDLYKELESYLHDTCKKYNIYFKKNNNLWTIERMDYYNDYILQEPTNIIGKKFNEEVIDKLSWFNWIPIKNVAYVCAGSVVIFSITFYIGNYLKNNNLYKESCKRINGLEKNIEILYDQLYILIKDENRSMEDVDNLINDINYLKIKLMDYEDIQKEFMKKTYRN